MDIIINTHSNGYIPVPVGADSISAQTTDSISSAQPNAKNNAQTPPQTNAKKGGESDGENRVDMESVGWAVWADMESAPT